MATIKEMAEKSFPYDVGFLYMCRRTGYIRGANEVLREIEKALDTALETCSIKDGYVKAREIIKELKGE